MDMQEIRLRAVEIAMQQTNVQEVLRKAETIADYIIRGSRVENLVVIVPDSRKEG
jgi:hypothetical protein